MEIDVTGEQTVYDWWSRHPRALDILYGVAFLGREEAIRRRAIDTLDLRAGERLLEVGCGNGNSFGTLREGIGTDGTLVGVDASRGMANIARRWIRDRDWRNVHVLRGDVRRPPLADGAFDAAYAAMSLSAVSNPSRAIGATANLLRPGGRFVVLDARPLQDWPWRLVNPVVTPVADYATDWVSSVDLVAVLRSKFETVTVSTYNAGSIFIACAETASAN